MANRASTNSHVFDAPSDSFFLLPPPTRQQQPASSPLATSASVSNLAASAAKALVLSPTQAAAPAAAATPVGNPFEDSAEDDVFAQAPPVVPSPDVKRCVWTQKRFGLS